MRKAINRILVAAVLIFTSYAAMAQQSTPAKKTVTKNKTEMKTFVIEREIPNAGKLTAAELKAASQNSCNVLRELGPKIQWDHSYVTGNKIYCIYKAESEELIRQHAQKAGLPANSISEVATVISPATAN